MIRRLFAGLAVVALGGAFLAGCGSGGSSTSSSQTSSTAAPTSPAAAATTSTPTTTTPSGAASSVGVLDAVASCKAVVQAAPTLSASTRTKAEGICNKAASGDLAGARQAAKEVCVEVIDATSALAGAAKERALAACKATK
jgi:hypothetical protein